MRPVNQIIMGAVKAAVTYATLSPTDKHPDAILSNGNLTLTSTTVGYTRVRATIGKSYAMGGKWYMEFAITNGSNGGTGCTIGYSLMAYALNGPDQVGMDSVSPASIGYRTKGGKVMYSASIAYSYSTATTGDVIGLALDMTTGDIKLYKNGVLLGTPSIGLTSGTWYPVIEIVGGAVGFADTITANFGQSPMSYPLAGYNQGLW